MLIAIGSLAPKEFGKRSSYQQTFRSATETLMIVVLTLVPVMVSHLVTSSSFVYHS